MRQRRASHRLPGWSGKPHARLVSDRAFRWGRVKTIVGWLTGDRRVEAEGRVEADTGHHPAPEEVRTAKHDVRADHGDLDETSTEGGSGHVEA